MSNLLIFAIIILANAFEITGFHRACQFELTDDGAGVVKDSRMILWKFGYWCYRNLGEFYSKPFYSCPVCMSSVHGILPFLVTYFILIPVSPMIILHWMFYTLTLAGVSAVVNR